MGTIHTLNEYGNEISLTLAEYSIKTHSFDPGATVLTRGFGWESADAFNFDELDPKSPMGKVWFSSQNKAKEKE